MGPEAYLFGEKNCKEGASCKPGSVVGDHLSEEHLAAFFSRPYPRVGGQPRPLLFGLAPDGVFLAWKSLSTRWALTPPFYPYPKKGGIFLWHFPLVCTNWVLPSVLPCGARTFLSSKKSGHQGYSRRHIISSFPKENEMVFRAQNAIQ